MSDSPPPGPPPIPEPSRAAEVARLELTRLPPDAPLDQVFRRTCELSAEVLDVERVGVWLFIDDRAALRCANLFERSKREHSVGAILQVADFPTYFSSLSVRKAVPAEIAASEPWTAELAAMYLRPLGISSVLDAGVFVDAALAGVVCHEHVGPPREWTTEARDFAGSVADLVALRIQSAAAREVRAAFLTQRERLADQEKAAALAQLAAGVAHDFQNLLTVFRGHGELIRGRADVPAAVRDQAGTIVAAAERGIGITRDLLAFARPVRWTTAVLDLGDVTARFLPVLRAAVGPRHQVRFAHPGPVGQVLIDETQYTRALLNLVLNARDALPDGGAVDVRLLPVNVTGHPSFAGRFLVLEVADHGAGMDEATRRRMFDPYFTTKPAGTGLGLSVVRQVVDRVGGLIRVESAPGRGTTVRVLFPRIGATSGETSQFAIPPELQRGDGG